MAKEWKIEVPTELASVKLRQYQKYIKIVNHNPDKEPTQEEIDFANLKLLECFCGISLKDAYNLELTAFSDILNHLSNIFKEKTPLQQRFTMVDIKGVEVEFGFIPNIEEITLGEFVDLEKYIQSWETMHKAMAILYRPIIHRNKNLYLIEDYEGSDKYSEAMLDSPLSVSLGANVFFYHLGKELSSHLMDSLANQMKSDNSLLQALVQNGVGINQFTQLLKEMSQNLRKLQTYPYSNV